MALDEGYGVPTNPRRMGGIGTPAFPRIRYDPMALRRHVAQMQSMANVGVPQQGGPGAGMMENRQNVMRLFQSMAMAPQQQGVFDFEPPRAPGPSYGPLDEMGMPWGMPHTQAGAEGLLSLLAMRGRQGLSGGY